MKRFLMYHGIGIIFKIAKFVGIYEKPQPLQYSMEEVEAFLNDSTKTEVRPEPVEYKYDRCTRKKVYVGEDDRSPREKLKDEFRG